MGRRCRREPPTRSFCNCLDASCSDAFEASERHHAQATVARSKLSVGKNRRPVAVTAEAGTDAAREFTGSQPFTLPQAGSKRPAGCALDTDLHLPPPPQVAYLSIGSPTVLPSDQPWAFHARGISSQRTTPSIAWRTRSSTGCSAIRHTISCRCLLGNECASQHQNRC
jgi:hypothetical protein